MAKLGHQQVPPAVDATDATNRSDPARSLATTTAPVVVSSAAPPTTGQVLKATSATVAEWADESGGGGGGGPIPPQFALAELSANQTFSLDAALDFDTLLDGDRIPVDGSGRFTLTEGKTYALMAGLQCDGGSSDYFYFQWYDVTGTAYIGKRGASRPTSTSHSFSDQSVALAVITAAAGQTVELRFQFGSGSGQATVLTSYAYLVELTTGSGFTSADYIVAERITTDQLNPVSGDAIQFNSALNSKSGGDLALDTTTNVGRFSGLKAGRTYALMSAIKSRNGGVPNSYLSAYWYNVTAAAPIVPNAVRSTRFLSNDTLNNQSNEGPAFHIFTPSVDTEVEMRLIIVNPAGTDVGTQSFGAIWELAGPQVGASAEKFVNIIRAGDVASHDSATPMIVSQFAFDPSEYNLTGAARSLVFRAVAANGGGVAQTKARLYSVTDTEYIGAGVTFTTASAAKQEETLTIGSGAGEVDDSEKVYEVHIWVVSPSPGDTIELGSAELRLVNTIN
jgi:hypothetical protein